jgi:hypothetical protein
MISAEMVVNISTPPVEPSLPAKLGEAAGRQVLLNRILEPSQFEKVSMKKKKGKRIKVGGRRGWA